MIVPTESLSNVCAGVVTPGPPQLPQKPAQSITMADSQARLGSLTRFLGATRSFD